MEAPNHDIQTKIDALTVSGSRPRLITIVAVDNGNGSFDLIYVFQQQDRLSQVRYAVKEDDELESLSSVYSGAVNMEREVVDMMGLHFQGISGGLLLTEGSGIVAPLRRPRAPAEVVKEEKK